MTEAADVGAVRAVITWGAPCVYAVCCMQAAPTLCLLISQPIASTSRHHSPHHCPTNSISSSSSVSAAEMEPAHRRKRSDKRQTASAGHQ